MTSRTKHSGTQRQSKCTNASVSQLRSGLHYAIDITEGDLPLLKESALSAGAKIAVVAPVDDALVCLVKGTVRGQQFHLEHGGEGSVLDVFGGDSTLAMDREDKASLWPDLTDSDAVTTIVRTVRFHTGRRRYCRADISKPSTFWCSGTPISRLSGDWLRGTDFFFG